MSDYPAYKERCEHGLRWEHFCHSCERGESKMVPDAKYQEALDAIQALVNHCGVMSPVWKLPRSILERERPILPPEDKPC